MSPPKAVTSQHLEKGSQDVMSPPKAVTSQHLEKGYLFATHHQPPLSKARDLRIVRHCCPSSIPSSPYFTPFGNANGTSPSAGNLLLFVISFAGLYVLWKVWKSLRAAEVAPQAFVILSTTGSATLVEEGHVADGACSLIQWLVEIGIGSPDLPLELKTDVNGLRGLYATQDISANQVLLAVPEGMFIREPESKTTPGLALMALDLLHRRQSREWAPYLAGLPRECCMPEFQYGAEELEHLQDANILRAALTQRRLAEECWQGLGPEVRRDATLADFCWAISILGSRCVAMPGSDGGVLSPGVEFANHSFAANAVLKFDSSDKPAVQLVTGSAGVQRGQEVTVQYGKFSNRVLFLSYGFVLDHNPYDNVVVFERVRDLAEFCSTFLASRWRWVSAKDLQRKLKHNLAPEPCRLFVAASMVDGRLTRALHSLDHSRGFPEAVVLARCRQLLAAYPTTVAEDLALLEDPQLSPNVRTCVRFRVLQKRILQATVDRLAAAT